MIIPSFDRRTAPLQRGVVDESLRDRIAEHDQSLQHHREIDIRDRPVAEEMVGAPVEQRQRRRAQLVGGLSARTDRAGRWPFEAE